jgi:hypothetical protein
MCRARNANNIWESNFFLSFFLSFPLFSLLLQVPGVKHSGPQKLVLYFTGATNILYTFGGHAVTVYV